MVLEQKVMNLNANDIILPLLIIDFDGDLTCINNKAINNM